MEKLSSYWEQYGSYWPEAVHIVLVIFLALVLLRVLRRVSAPFFWLTRALVWSVAIVLILSNLGYDVSSLIAGLGIGGVAMALAAQETLSNVFGYISIVMDKPFKIGDTITVDKYSGTVKSMRLRSTRLEQKDGVVVFIPNKIMAALPIENLSNKTK